MASNMFINGDKNNKKGYRFLLTLNEEQKLAKARILQSDIAVILGKAGSGKTLLACQIALQMLLEKQVNKIVITRPTISKEEIGFLPGNLDDKMGPWVAPVYSNMYQLLRKERIDQLIHNDQIEVVPVSYMRGRTFLNSAIIVDECQNLEHDQTLMILQRIGLHSKMFFCGDTDQIDLKRKHDTGLDFLSSISIQRLELIKLLTNHRHPILDDIMLAYSQSLNEKEF